MIAFGLIAGALSGCAVVDSSIDDRYDSIDRSAGRARNESVLRNIARASQKVPLTFMAFSKVSGGLSANVAAAMPSFSLGPHGPAAAVQRDVTIGNTTLGTSSSATNAVDIAVLESSDFYRALLNPGDLIDFNILVQQGYPRELLFWLFADSVRITVTTITPQQGAAQPKEQESLPKEQESQRPRRQSLPSGRQSRYWEIHNRVEKSESCEDIPPFGVLCFSDMVDLAMITGLSVKVTPAAEADHARQIGAKSGSGTNITIYNSSSDTARRTPNSRLCRDHFFEKEARSFAFGEEINRFKKRRNERYSPSRALGQLLEFIRIAHNPAHYCDVVPISTGRRNARSPITRPDSAGPSPGPRLSLKSTFTLKGKTIEVTYEIKTRSTFAIYQFLGQILEKEKMNEVLMTGLEIDTDDNRKILAVTKDRSSDCAVSTTLRNNFYCVPEQAESRNTKLIFSLLTQLIALKTQTKDLGITPTVRLSTP